MGIIEFSYIYEGIEVNKKQEELFKVETIAAVTKKLGHFLVELHISVDQNQAGKDLSDETRRDLDENKEEDQIENDDGIEEVIIVNEVKATLM